ncbi:MAG: PASTA domain-containing protein [Microthrixaceae bacterium]
MPEQIVGVPVAAAEAALAEVQLGSSVSEEYSSEVDAGVVLRASAEPGSQLPRDSTVELVVSAGPEPIPVPDVSGQTGAAAASALEEAGFTVSGIEGSPSGGAGDRSAGRRGTGAGFRGAHLHPFGLSAPSPEGPRCRTPVHLA